MGELRLVQIPVGWGLPGVTAVCRVYDARLPGGTIPALIQTSY